MAQVTRRRESGDATPCKDTPVSGDTTPCRITGVTLHGVVSPERERVLYCQPTGPDPLCHRDDAVDRPHAMGG